MSSQPQYRCDAAPGPMIRREGKRVFVAPIARTGEHPYGKGERGPGSPAGVERRDRAELERIVKQINADGKPITVRHPRGLIEDGAKPEYGGKAARAWMEGELAWAELHLDDAGIAALNVGMRELSLGYSTHPDDKGFQRDTKVDHLAMVFASRCGPTCTIRADHSGCSCSGRNAVVALADQLLASRMTRWTQKS